MHFELGVLLLPSLEQVHSSDTHVYVIPDAYDLQCDTVGIQNDRRVAALLPTKLQNTQLQ